jgi:hypothetical protein
MLKPEDTDEWDCAEAIMLVLRRLLSAVRIWRRRTKKYAVEFFLGLSMPSKNKGFGLSAAAMKYLGDRGIEAGFDIYNDGKDDAEPLHRTAAQHVSGEFGRFGGAAVGELGRWARTENLPQTFPCASQRTQATLERYDERPNSDGDERGDPFSHPHG